MSVHFTSRSISIEYTVQTQTKPPILSWSEKEALRELISMPFDPILDNDRYWDFRDLGQKLFNKFKIESYGCPLSAKESLKRILDSIPFNSSENGLKLKEHVNKAWEGVGDESLQWGRF